MDLFLFIVGFLGFVIMIILSIIGSIKKNGKLKRNLIGIAIFFFVAIVGVSMNTSTDNSSKNVAKANKETLQTTKDAKKEDKSNKSDSKKEEDIFIDNNTKTDSKPTTETVKPVENNSNTVNSNQTNNNTEVKNENKVSISYIGNKSTHKFHKSTCGEVNKMSDKNKITLSNRDGAINEGYSPCQKCNP